MALTPTVREFLIRLEDLLDERAWPRLDRDAVVIGSGHDSAHVVLPHRQADHPQIEIQVEPRTVRVIYWPEHVTFTSRDEALQFIEMLGDGRVVLEVARTVGWTTMRSYRDDLALPFRRTRMPWPTLRPRTERIAFGFND